MAEPRRIKLESAHEAPQSKKKRFQLCPTKRFQLSLGDFTPESACPEFSYSDLLKSKRPPDIDGPFEDGEEAQIRELARRMEEKYGSRPSKKRRKGKIAWEDYVDRGMGYDETDPFIDNEEAYDELVPSTLTTKHGGFYINAGGLEFRTPSGSDSEDFQDTSDGRPRSGANKVPQRHHRREHGDPERRRGRPRGSRKLKEAAAPPVPTPPIAPAVATDTAVVAASPVVVAVGASSGITEAIESVVRGGGSSVTKDEETSGTSSSSSGGGEDRTAVLRCSPGETGAPRLPENLPEDLEAAVRHLKQAAFTSAEGKCKFFRGQVNQQLLNVELLARELGSSQRSLVFAHLASFLPCTKETLLKRAKKLRLDQEDGRLGEPLKRLKEAMAAGAGLGDPRFREPLCDVVRIKLRCYELSKTRTLSAEDYLKQFLNNEVCPLWPAGSQPVSARALFRESRVVHAHLTAKPRKPALPPPVPGPRRLQMDEEPATPPPSTSSSVVLQSTSSLTITALPPATPPPSSTPTPTAPAVSVAIASPPVTQPVPTSVPTSVILQSPGKPPPLQDSRPHHSSPPAKPQFLASQMLDRIITASLGNFPSSGMEGTGLSALSAPPLTNARALESSPSEGGPSSASSRGNPVQPPPRSSLLQTAPARLPHQQPYGFLEAFKRGLEQEEPPASSYYKADVLEGMKGFPYPVGYVPRSRSAGVSPSQEQHRPKPHLSVAQQPQPQHWRQRVPYPQGTGYPPHPPRPYPYPPQSHQGSKGAAQGQGHAS